MTIPRIILHGREEPESLLVMHDHSGVMSLIFPPTDDAMIEYRDRTMNDLYQLDIHHEVG